MGLLGTPRSLCKLGSAGCSRVRYLWGFTTGWSRQQSHLCTMGCGAGRLQKYSPCWLVPSDISLP